MNQNILNAALKVIDARRLAAEATAKKNKEQALKLPEFFHAHNDYITSVIDDAKQGQVSEKTKALKRTLDTLSKKLEVGAIEPAYFCPVCHDNGYSDGKPCQCLKSEINKILVEQSGFGELCSFQDARFDIFENSEYMKRVYQKLEAWCKSDFKKNMVYLSGGTGTGKTYLLKCMANELIARGKLTTLVTAYKLNQDFLKSHSSRDLKERDAIISQYMDIEVLFIDDLGTEITAPGITNSYIYALLNERKVRNLPTVITSNLTMFDLTDKYDERITSRISDETTIKIYFDGEDLRRKQKN